MTVQIRCHYDVLSVPRDADAAAIKKAHRKAALIHHPDKNVNKSEEEQNASVAEFKLIQAAYECLSDPVERKWYDEHRDMILRGGLHGSGGDGVNDGSTFLYDVMPYQFAGCYDGYDDNHPDSFYSVYNEVFSQVFQGEKDGFISEGNIDVQKMSNYHLSEVSLGNSTSAWENVLAFYSSWEGFTSCLSYAWADDYHLDDIREAPNRKIRRLMEEENKKKRKAAKIERVEEVVALVRFVKKRDPRVREQREKACREQALREVERKKEAKQRQKDLLAAKEEWRVEAERTMAEQEAADLSAGRVRLADLDSDDDYDYGVGKRGGRKKGRRKGKSKRGNDVMQNEELGGECTSVAEVDSMKASGNNETVEVELEDFDEKEIDCSVSSVLPGSDSLHEVAIVTDNVEELCNGVDNVELASDGSTSQESSEEEDPDSWRCECCRKDFKSHKQFENHEQSKKHKEMLKKYEKKFQKEALQDMMDELEG
ncbi:hypothetical protein ACHAXH_003444 [Discostella pseudostelligera]